MKLRQLLFWLLLVYIPITHARDVSAQQAAYNNALKKYESAEEQYKADADSVAELERVIEKRKKQLAEEQKRLEISKAKFLEAKEKLDQTQLVLDKAWKE